MKIASIFVALAMPITICAGVYTGRCVTITDTNFAFRFEDETLSSANMRRIADDVALIRQSWTNSEILFEIADGFNGVVIDRLIEGSPYAEGNLTVPRHFSIENGTNFLFVSKTLSDAYSRVFDFLDSDTNILSSARSFVEGLSSNRLDAVQSNEVYRLVLYPGKSVSAYAAKRDSIIRQLKEQQYLQPSSLAFFQTEPGINGFPSRTTWVKIPAKHWSTMDKNYALGFFYAVWHEGIWRIYPIGL